MAKEFAKRKAKLVLWDLNEQNNLNTQKELKLLGFRNVHAFKIDITDQAELKSTAARVKSEIGDVDVVVMAAAPTFKPRSILETNYTDDIEKHFKIGYVSQLWLIQEFLPPMIKKNDGHFVTISSFSSLVDIPLVSSYASIKLAQTKLIETMREEVIANGVKGIITTIVYPSVLKGGLADGFFDSYDFDKDYLVSGEDAAKQIVQSVVKNEEYLFMPKVGRYSYILKFLLSPRVLGDFVLFKSKINPKYLKLKNKAQ